MALSQSFALMASTPNSKSGLLTGCVDRGVGERRGERQAEREKEAISVRMTQVPLMA